MPKIDRIGYTYMQHVVPSPGAPTEGKGASVEIRSYALRNSSPKTTQKSSVLAGAIGVLEGRKVDDDLCWGHVGVVQSALLGALHVCTSRASRQS